MGQQACPVRSSKSKIKIPRMFEVGGINGKNTDANQVRLKIEQEEEGEGVVSDMMTMKCYAVHAQHNTKQKNYRVTALGVHCAARQQVQHGEAEQPRVRLLDLGRPEHQVMFGSLMG